MEKEKPRSFRLSRETMFDNTIYGDMSKKDWWKFKKVSYKVNYRNLALLFIFFLFLIPTLFPVGSIALIIWIILWIKHKLSQPREVVIASKTLTPEDIKKFLGNGADNLTNEEAQKLFMELPVEKQMEAVFSNSPKELKRERNVKIIVSIIVLVGLAVLPFLLLN